MITLGLFSLKYATVINDIALVFVSIKHVSVMFF